MSHVRALCRATVDHPHADGIVLDGGFGLLQQFRFLDHFETRAGDLSRHPMPEWDTSSEGQYNVEVIPELKAVGPRGVCGREDMTLYVPGVGGDWQPTNSPGWPNCSNLWKTVYPVGHPRALCLFYYDARGAYDATAGYFGEVTSRFDWPADPNLVLHAYRYAPNPTLPASRYCYVELQLLGDSQTGQWSLGLPVAGTEGQARYPRLGWRQAPADEWQVLREFRVAPHEARALRSKPFEQVVTWETVDGHFLLNLDGRREVFYVPARYRREDGAAVAAGPVRIVVYGHAAIINLTPVRYPLGELAACAVQRAEYFPVANTIFGATPAFRAVAWEPEGTAASPGGTVTTVGDEDRWLPRVTFTSTRDDRRAVAYLHEMDLAPTVSAGTSDPYATQGGNVLLQARGELTGDWRDAWCRVVLDVERSAVANLPAWKGNNKLAVTAGWDDGEAEDVAPQFTGYLVEAAHLRSGQRPDRVALVLNARDGFLRLQRKHWQHLGCFAGWTLEAAFHRVLNQCGVPDLRISYTGDPNLVIPYGERKTDLRFDFAEDVSVPEGLDRMVRACGYTWGVNQDGTWFCGPPVEYGGTPDFILDDDVVGPDAAVFALRADTVQDAAPRGRAFANSVFVRIDRGAEQELAWWRDADSHQEPSAEDFIGDDWWHLFVGHDEQSAATLAQRLLEERQTRRKLLHFRCVGKPSLFPDHFMEVNASGITVPAGSLFRIVRKRWEARPDGDFATEFACRLVPEVE
jgi:hypothetical protein